MELYFTKEHKQVPSLLLGEVIANYDKEHKGMVKISYYAYGKEANKTDWIRVMSPMAGKKRGFYFLPEIGDEVVIAFLNNDINNPCVIGCLWNQVDVFPEKVVTEDNTVKTLVTKSGMQVLFSEEKKKEKIQINTPKKITISLEDETNTIEIKDSKGSNKFIIKGEEGSITIASDQKIVIESKQVEIKADVSLKIESPQIGINAKAEIKLESSGITEIKGSMVKING